MDPYKVIEPPPAALTSLSTHFTNSASVTHTTGEGFALFDQPDKYNYPDPVPYKEFFYRITIKVEDTTTERIFPSGGGGYAVKVGCWSHLLTISSS